MQIPLEVFEMFFGNFMKKKAVINIQEFTDLIADAENKLFDMVQEEDN